MWVFCFVYFLGGGGGAKTEKVKLLNCYFLPLHVQRARELLLFLRDYVR